MCAQEGTQVPTSHWLDVPGARLYYEVLGEGPVLLLAGHPMGTAGFARVVPLLAEDYTVVTFDPRGFYRSRIDDPSQDAEPGLLADDARRVLEAAGEPPWHILGSSGGAVTGLALVAKCPRLVKVLVAHEPPLAPMLPEPDEVLRRAQHVYDTYRRHGERAAWQHFFAFTGMRLNPQGDNPAPPVPTTSDRFFLHGLLPITTYEPDIPALRAAPGRIVVAVGAASKSAFAGRAAAALAQRLGKPLVQFPGGHIGFATDPEPFAAALRRALS